MREVADKFNVAKSTVYNCRNRVCAIVANHSSDFIQWPMNTADRKAAEDDFAKLGKFPGY